MVPSTSLSHPPILPPIPKLYTTYRIYFYDYSWVSEILGGSVSSCAGCPTNLWLVAGNSLVTSYSYKAHLTLYLYGKSSVVSPYTSLFSLGDPTTSQQH